MWGEVGGRSRGCVVVGRGDVGGGGIWRGGRNGGVVRWGGGGAPGGLERGRGVDTLRLWFTSWCADARRA